jgi:hypothetical protein
MKKVTDFSKYTDTALRKLLIDNAKPIASGMERVTREITKKYNACDREMLLWYINQPPYNGVLWAPDVHKLTAEEQRHRVREMEQAQQKRLKRPEVVKMPVITQTYKIPTWKESFKKKGIIEQFKELGCKPVRISDKTVGIVKMGSYARIEEIKAAFPDWQVIEYD